MPDPTTALIVGAGPSGIALGYHLKKKLRIDDFVIVDKNAGAGGTWYSNFYPGCGCDIPSHLYSFSFALNPNWSKPLAEQEEILEYMNSVVDRSELRPHMLFETACTGARWNEESMTWGVGLENLKSGYRYTREVSGHSWLGHLSRETLHLAAWNNEYDLTNKRVAVIGNGCSGSQLIPAIAPEVKQLTHYIRSRQWFFERPNKPYTAFTLWCYRNIPLAMQMSRFIIYWIIDSQYGEFLQGPDTDALRARSENESREYMLRKAPRKYHDCIIPDYPSGCKRRVFDPGYLDALHLDHVKLEPGKLSHIDENGIVLQDGTRQDFEAIVLATGYSTQNFLAPMEIYGQEGKSLNDHWKETQGCQAYNSIAVSGFPNLAIVFGPNGSPTHNSAICHIEVQVEYIIKTYFEPLVFGRAKSISVKRSAEDRNCNAVQLGLKNSVWSAGCSNYNNDETGRNCTNYPGNAKSYWWKLRSPDWADFILKGDEKKHWYLRHALFKVDGKLTSLAAVILFAAFSWVCSSRSSQI